jgi:predicted RND superfamily exporter protein
MGVVLGFGVAVALILAMTLTPILFSVLKPPKVKTYENSWSQKLLGHFLFQFEEYILKIPWRVVALFAIAFIATILGISQMVVETDFNKRLAEDNWIRIDETYYNKHFAGANFLEIFVETPEENGIFDAETFEAIQAFQQELEALPEIDKISSAVNLIETIDREMNPQGEIPLSDELLAQYVLLFEMSGGEDLDRIVDFERRTMRVAARMAEDGFMFSHEAGEKAREIGERLLDGKARVEMSGLTYLLGGFLDEILSGQRAGLAFAFITILVMMALMFKSFKIGLWSMVPNVLPLLALGGYVGYFWDVVDTDTIIVAMIAIGIGVDDTIHFLTRLKFESARNADPIDALQRAFHFCGRAMVSTTLILALGFLPFAVSDYFTVHMFGTLLPYTLIVAVLADILLVPALVKLGFVRFPSK